MKTGAIRPYSATCEGSRGLFFKKRTADTYGKGSGEKTHRTEMVTKGVLFPMRVAETMRTNQSDGEKTITRPVIKSIFFRKRVDETDKTYPQRVAAPD